MKLRNLFYSLLIIVFSVIYLKAQNTNPVVSNVAFSISGTTVTVTYNVSDAEQSTVTISMYVSSDGGGTWDYYYGSASGAIGAGVSTGNGKTITWTYSGSYNPDFKIRINANDETVGGSPCPGIATIYYGGKTYNTIQIGTQCWLKENLDIGTKIAGSLNQTDNSIIEKYCYGDLDANCTTYGGLYQWNEAMQYVTTVNTQGICPTGWHIPQYFELQILKNSACDNSNILKAVSQGTESGVGTNTSGFSYLLAGYRYTNGTFTYLGTNGYIWSTNTYDEAQTQAYYMEVLGSTSTIYLGQYFYRPISYGYSIRCLKD